MIGWKSDGPNFERPMPSSKRNSAYESLSKNVVSTTLKSVGRRRDGGR